MNYIKITVVLSCLVLLTSCGKPPDTKTTGPNYDLTPKELETALGMSHVNIYFPESTKPTKVALGLKSSTGLKLESYATGVHNGHGKVIWTKSENIISYTILSENGSIRASLQIPDRFKYATGGKISDNPKIYGNGSLIAKWGDGSMTGDEVIRENEIGLILIIEGQ